MGKDSVLYLHDVWTNWFTGEKNGCNVCEFHEWRKSDTVELFDQIPLIKVDEALFDYIENDMNEIQDDLLESIRHKAYMRREHERVQIEYGFVATDGKRIIAVNTLSYRIPMKKSRLIPRQEQLVFEMTQDRSVDFTYKPSESYSDYDDIIIDQSSLRGLTRRERKLKELLYTVLQDIYFEGNLGKLKYLYVEMNPSGYLQVKDLNLDEVYETINKYIAAGWNKEYENALMAITKGISYYEKAFESENVINVR